MPAVSRLLAVVLVTLAFASGSGSSRDPQIYVGPDGPPGAGVAYTDTHAGHSYIFADLMFCLDSSGTITIDRIEQINAQNDLTVDGFMLSQDYRELERIGALGVLPPGIGAVTMDLRCPRSVFNMELPPDPHEVRLPTLVIQVSKPTEEPATNDGIVIVYTSGGHQYRLALPYEMGLCGPRNETDSPRAMGFDPRSICDW